MSFVSGFLEMCTNTDDGYKSADESDVTSKTSNRQRMKPWLIERLNSKKIDGFQWVDEHEKSFRIPWRHGSRHGWNMRRDAGLFEQWAIHSGKYNIGQKPDPKKWKANFRCALNSLRDVEELKHEGEKRGGNAFKIYKFLEKRRPRTCGMLSKHHTKKVETRGETREERQKKTYKCTRKIKSEPTTDYDMIKKETVDDFSSEHETLKQHNDNNSVHKGIKKSIKHHYSGYTLVKQNSDSMTEDEESESEEVEDEKPMLTSSCNNTIPSDGEIVNLILEYEDGMCSKDESKPVSKIHLTIEDIKTICSRITGVGTMDRPKNL